MFLAALSSPHGDAAASQRLAQAFARHNPGYTLTALHGARGVPEAPAVRVVFFHGGAGEACTPRATSPFVCGDIALLSAGEALEADATFDAVVFACPAPLPADLPVFLRPDHDPAFADQPGGCATDAGAYRRVLLTWSPTVGPFLYHGLNAHRVRMDDSFSHFHPRDVGFDELYLVQAAAPGAAILHSGQVDRILAPETVRPEEVSGLVERIPVAAGDLVYIPRGEMHRGVGGLLAQVITVPGFVPGRELGLDHCLRAINERLGLSGARALPYHAAASRAPVVR